MDPNQNRSADAPIKVAELQGLYGVYGFPEKLLQQIWARRDFDPSATTLNDGRPIAILDPGRWNLLGGPDFRDARIAIAGDRARHGDIELHLHAEDWQAHHHAADPAYARVILHVVLFPPPPHHRTTDATGTEIPTLPLLAALPHDLESYAADAVVGLLADRPFHGSLDELIRLPPDDLQARLITLASARWREKLRFCGLRLARLGWEAACHHAALEVLGYRFNRPPMLRIAGRFPLADWRRGAVDPDLAHGSESGRWSHQGARPANHPLVRLDQYRRWIDARPDWPKVVLQSKGLFADAGIFHGQKLRGFLCGDAVPSTRFNSVIADALLPLLAAHTSADLEPAWLAWPAGDAPGQVLRTLRLLGVAPALQVHIQGLIRFLAVGQKTKE